MSMYKKIEKKDVNLIERCIGKILEDKGIVPNIKPYGVTHIEEKEKNILEISIDKEIFIKDVKDEINKCLKDLYLTVLEENEKDNRIILTLRGMDKEEISNRHDIETIPISQITHGNQRKVKGLTAKLFYPIYRSEAEDYFVNVYYHSEEILFNRSFVHNINQQGEIELIMPEDETGKTLIDIQIGGIDLDNVKKIKIKILNLLPILNHNNQYDNYECGQGEEWVSEYQKEDGTHVEGYCRSKENKKGGKPHWINPSHRRRR